MMIGAWRAGLSVISGPCRDSAAANMAATPHRLKPNSDSREFSILCNCLGTRSPYVAAPGRTRRSGREVSDRYSILVVEDDALIAMELGERLADMGYDVLGPAATVAEAEAVVARKRPDAALLDSNLGGVSSTALAATLAANGVPLAFCTGYDSIKNLPLELKNAPILTKPIADADLLKVLKQLIA